MPKLFAEELFPLLVVLYAALIFAVLLVVKFRHDLRNLKFFTRSLIRGEPVSTKLGFRTKLAQDVWNSMAILQSRQRAKERNIPSLDETIDVGRRISRVSDTVEDASSEVAKILHEKLGHDLIATAVVFSRAQSNNYELVSIEGLPEGRVSQSLLSLFDYCKDRDSWGFFMSSDFERLFDLRSFNINSCLCVPLELDGVVRGSLWMGFKRGGVYLTPKRKATISALAEHAAASFAAASKSVERTDKSNQERDILLGLSHDLKAPGSSALYAIRELLDDESAELEESQISKLNLIEQSLEEQKSFLADVFDFAKHQRGALEATPIGFELEPAVSKVVELLKPLASSSGLEISCDFTSDFQVEFDPQHFRRILSNFLSNAIKYSNQGVINISALDLGDKVEITVSDEGIGVPEKQQHLLFNQFSRLPNSAGQEGVGLGLALSKALVELGEGEIFYRPAQTVGSIFGIRVPKQKKSSSKSELCFETIMVVDDNPAACRAHMRIVRALAKDVVPASSLEEARQVFSVLKPDLLICDFRLGSSNSEEFLKDTLLSSGTSCILLTGNAADPGAQKLKRLGALVMEKPVDRDTLQKAVMGFKEGNSAELLA